MIVILIRAIFTLILLLPSIVSAFCYEEAGAMYNVSPDLLRAIAQVESSENPDAVNESNKNGSYDYGLMQINSGWAKKIGVELWNELADPCMNVKVGAWILADCIYRHGRSWKAVGCYNSPTPKRQKVYIAKVKKVFIGSRR